MACRAVPGIVAGMNDRIRLTARRAERTPLVRSYVQRIDASPEAVFPLLCPVREGEWLEGWAETCEVIWSASGLAEPGCVVRGGIEQGRVAAWRYHNYRKILETLPG